MSCVGAVWGVQVVALLPYCLIALADHKVQNPGPETVMLFS